MSRQSRCIIQQVKQTYLCRLKQKINPATEIEELFEYTLHSILGLPSFINLVLFQRIHWKNLHSVTACGKKIVVLILFIISSQTCASALEVRDKKERQIVFAKPFTRIISLYGAHTENLYYLGLEDNIIGVSINDTFPEKVDKKPKFSYHDGPEKFLFFKPDLVLIRPMIDNGYPKLIERLEKSGITIVSLQPSGIKEMYDYWLKLGLLTGREKQSQNMVHDFQQKVEKIKGITSRIPNKKTVYFEAIHTRMKTFTQTAMPIFALETAGGINIAGDAISSRNTNIANYGKEQILAKAENIDVFLAQQGVMNAVNIAIIKKEPGFNVIKAIKNNQVYLIDESIVSRPVFRLYKGIVAIGTILYPDIFIKQAFTQ
ncbi:MAG: ABC transporter substrate-binding protein [Desulfobacula sp.]|nr:ABC transporter substrate-binding protein [Desulfobacula sp.]